MTSEKRPYLASEKRPVRDTETWPVLSHATLSIFLSPSLSLFSSLLIPLPESESLFLSFGFDSGGSGFLSESLDRPGSQSHLSGLALASRNSSPEGLPVRCCHGPSTVTRSKHRDTVHAPCPSSVAHLPAARQVCCSQAGALLGLTAAGPSLSGPTAATFSV